MNRFNSTLAIALVCAGFGVGALAQDKPNATQNSDKTKVVPSKKDVQQTQPSNEMMDQNAQRAHDRNTGSTPPPSTKAQRPATTVGEVRDWNAIDKNHDHLISPEEMEAALKPTTAESNKGTNKQ